MSVQQLIEKQRKFFLSNKTKDIQFRLDNLRKLRRLLKENEDVLYEAILEDFGKSSFDTYTVELSLVYSEVDLAIRKLKKWSKPRRVRSNLANLPSRNFIYPEPLGVSLLIGPWNYPFFLLLSPAIGAIAAGNTVVLKPSELPKRCSQAIYDIFSKNFPEEYIAVVQGSVPETTELLAQKFDKIFFSGSTRVGRIVYEAAAKNLTPVTLELGGKSPCFVFSDCQLKMTVQRLAWAKFINAGQTCIAPDYVLVEASFQDKFLTALKEELKKYPSTAYDNPENYTQIINEAHFDRLQNLIDKDRLYCGGHTVKKDRFISPTILSNIEFDHPIMQDEIFGPILPVIPFTDLDKVIENIKKKDKPLSTYIYSKDRKTIKKILTEVSFGGGSINDSLMHISNPYLPFGGVGESGTGQYRGKAGFETFSHQKSIMRKSFFFEPNIKYAPYTSFKLKLIKKVMG